MKGLRLKRRFFPVSFQVVREPLPFAFYAFPDFGLIPHCVQKILQDQATSILITPFWNTQAWFPQLLQLLYDQPWILKTVPQVDTAPLKGGTTSTVQILETDGLSCLWRSYETAGISADIAEVLMSSWRAGTQKQYNIYLKKCLAFCREGKE